ncbi:CAP domain-containing protein [Nocardioides sp. zg-536]|uniref:CAP domain-containing protein n=1 Tax=Nocardioides faecalis TaxID=2803858 RepID=A0A939BSJ1_9ACTN|nr:CAP domain-containing protein [Nocardioides faecalis]MBM9459684.1 CAP domain-containing protein [Nocardioides faecalis]QVI58203.1 CAP domain-containing protein [Nocardioides faecalis]
MLAPDPASTSVPAPRARPHRDPYRDAPVGAGRRAYRTLVVVLLGAVVAAGTLLAPGSARAGGAAGTRAATAAAPAPTVDARAVRKGTRLAVKPNRISNGQVVRVRGKVPGGPRKIRVQVHHGKGAWQRVATTRTRKTGTFNVRVALSVPASVSRLKVRVLAPRAKVRGKKRAAAVTPSRVVISRGAPIGTTTERQVLTLANRERAAAGCGPLVMEARLRAAARGHSADMAARNYFSHDSLDGRTFADRIEAAGYRSWQLLGENIAAGQRSATEVMRDWMNSPGHRRNILNCSFTEIGVGHVVRARDGRAYWTQDFGRR